MLASRGYDLVHIQTPFFAHYLGLGIAKAPGCPGGGELRFFEPSISHHYVPFPTAWMQRLARDFSTAQCNVSMRWRCLARHAEVAKGYGVKTPATVIPTGIELVQFSQGRRHRFRKRSGHPAGRPF